MLDKIIYAKTSKWEYENEYRLAIPIHADGRDWNTLPYYSEEISELYLGHKMPDETKKEITGLSQAVNPEIAIFDILLGGNGKLSFRQR